jgi:TonB family protein
LIGTLNKLPRVILAPSLRHRLAVFLLFPMLAAPLAAQNVLLAEDSGKLSLVCAANGRDPCVERDGKLVQISSKGFVLKEVPDYLPVFISVTDVDARTTYEDAHASGGGGQLNNDFHFNARIKTSYALNDVFLVLYLETESAGNVIFLSEIGNLDPYKSRPIAVYVPMSAPLGRGRYTLHLFSGGAEVFQTQIPFWNRENSLNRMVAARVKDLQSAPPKLLIGPAPEYPPALRKANINGQAVISVRIGANGGVNDPVVKSATDPAFGEAALVAMRDWRFIPKVKEGRPVESRADVPFVFSPPNAAKESS